MGNIEILAISKTSENLSFEESSILEKFEEKGFWYYPSWTMDAPITPERIKLPSGKLFSINELDEILEKDANNLDVKMALEFYGVIRDLYPEDRYGRYFFSFEDKKDEDQCAIRYKGAMVYP